MAEMRIRRMPWGTSWAASTGLLVAFLTCVYADTPSLAKRTATASQPDAATAALVAEVRRSFTVHGKPIPPEIFRDFGDGDMADSGSIWVTVDVAAATGSNLYYDTIKQDGGTVAQTKSDPKADTWERTAYNFIGSTDNGLLVVVAGYSGGGSGDFMTLHILDLAAVRAFEDGDGKSDDMHWRVNLTIVRNIVLGDRWDGGVTIKKNAIVVTTAHSGPADDKGRPPMTIMAARP
jgi:hypothetical protein